MASHGVFRYTSIMTNEERRQDSVKFACQVLGLDGVSGKAAEPGTVVWRLGELEREYEAEGRSEEEYIEAAQVILASVDPG